MNKIWKRIGLGLATLLGLLLAAPPVLLSVRLAPAAGAAAPFLLDGCRSTPVR